MHLTRVWSPKNRMFVSSGEVQSLLDSLVRWRRKEGRGRPGWHQHNHLDTDIQVAPRSDLDSPWTLTPQSSQEPLTRGGQGLLAILALEAAIGSPGSPPLSEPCPLVSLEPRNPQACGRSQPQHPGVQQTPPPYAALPKLSPGGGRVKAQGVRYGPQNLVIAHMVY